MNSVKQFYHRHFNLCLVGALLMMGALAWMHRFIQDDAFISLSYSRALVEGKGLVWNGSEHVEGYTNFLWTVIHAIPFALHVDPVLFSCVLGIALFLVALVCAYGMARLLFHSNDLALLTMILLGVSAPFSYWATGGMEAMLQAALFTACCWMFVAGNVRGTWNNKQLAGLSLMFSAAMLSRLDAFLMCAVLICALTFSICKSPSSRSLRWQQFACLVLPVVIVVGLWRGWAFAYYGALLPNPFYAKVHASPETIVMGMKYVVHFLESTWLVPFPILTAVVLASKRSTIDRGILAMLCIIGAWLLYVVYVGGDFMEFRFLVPIIPLGMTVIVWLSTRVVTQKMLQRALLIIVVAGSIHHAVIGVMTPTVESIQGLESHLIHAADGNWIGVGNTLGRAFAGNPNVIIALTPAGAIPFCSRLTTVDMLGLNDAWIARNGKIVSDRPGHRIASPSSYLISRRVNLVIGHPWVVKNVSVTAALDTTNARLRLLGLADDGITPDAQLVVIPISPSYSMIAMYLVHSAAVDAVVRREGWMVYPIATVANTSAQ